jgi:hypothetical protein
VKRRHFGPRPVAEPQAGLVLFARGKAKDLGSCDFCKARLAPDLEDMLSIFSDEGNFQSILCEFHEGMLLKRLLENYIRRVRRRSLVGFTSLMSKNPDIGSMIVED